MLQKTNDHIMLTNKTYNIGKQVVQVYIPAVSSLYFGLGNIWGFPFVEEVVGTLAVVATFIGVCLGLSAKSYNESEVGYEGHLVVENTEEGKILYSLEVNGDPEDLKDKDSVAFKVNHRE